MLQIISPKDSKIILDNISPNQNIDMINKHINICDCQNITVDITKLNLMDACRVSTVCSTTHYMKYPEGRINWVVNSDKVKEYTTPMLLGNSVFLRK